MWRAFFFAVGTILVILGLQCLVVDQFFVSQNGKVSEMFNKALNVIEPQNPNVQRQYSVNSTNPAFANQNNGYIQPQNSGSPYGPSRFQTPFYSPPQTTARNPATYGGQQFRNAGFRTPVAPNAKMPKPPRPVKTKDWMPWSLLAAGTIIVLYTNSTGRNAHYQPAE